MTSTLLPWSSAYEMEDLPDFPAIADELAFAGKLARAYKQRLTFHPSHFVKVAAPTEDLLKKSLKELKVHSQASLPSHSKSVVNDSKLPDAAGCNMCQMSTPCTERTSHNSPSSKLKSTCFLHNRVWNTYNQLTVLQFFGSCRSCAKLLCMPWS